jgi:hypothetical protein
MALNQNRFCPQSYKQPINVGENKWHACIRRSFILEEGYAYLNELLSSIWTKFAHNYINDPLISGIINVMHICEEALFQEKRGPI